MSKSLFFKATLVLLLCLLTSVDAFASTRDPGSHFFQETFGNMQEELEIANEEDKQGLLVFFEMDDCPFCRRMKQTVLNQSEVQDYFREHFRIFPMDIEGDLEITDFNGETVSQKDFSFKQFRVRATPVIAFFDLDGKLITRYTGATRDTQEFMLLGKFVVEGHYKDENFTHYKREQRK